MNTHLSNIPMPPGASCGSRNPIARGVAGLILLLIAGVTVYSIYVAVHTPDPQETVILGQDKIASGSSAGLRILVRNRISGKGIQGARVELSLLGKKTCAVKLGTVKTDS